MSEKQAAEIDGTEPDFRPAIIRGLEARFKAVLAACELAEAEGRHVVDDEVYVSVGLIRNALRTSGCQREARGHAEQAPRSNEVWDESVAPGGYVCVVCGVPTESEPCGKHQHTRTSTGGHGPDFCRECSDAISDWVQWPCPAMSIRSASSGATEIDA